MVITIHYPTMMKRRALVSNYSASPVQCPHRYVVYVCLVSGGAGLGGTGAGVVGGTGGIPGVAPGAGGGARVIAIFVFITVTSDLQSLLCVLVLFTFKNSSMTSSDHR